jgi:hypothetical protein
MAVGETGASAVTAVENQAAEAIQVLLLPPSRRFSRYESSLGPSVPAELNNYP